MVALIAVVCLTAVRLLGAKLNAIFNQIAAAVQGSQKRNSAVPVNGRSGA